MTQDKPELARDGGRIVAQTPTADYVVWDSADDVPEGVKAEQDERGAWRAWLDSPEEADRKAARKAKAAPEE